MSIIIGIIIGVILIGLYLLIASLIGWYLGKLVESNTREPPDHGL